MSSPKRIALVTGAARGIGAAIAKELEATCAHVVLLDLDPSFSNTPAQAEKVLRFCCDVGDSAAVHATLEKVQPLVGLPNVLVNNAGRGGPFHRVDEVSDDEWYALVNTNLKSVFNLSRALLPAMKRNDFGRIVNIASVQGYLGAARSSTYVACKHGVIGYTRAIAAEWGAFGITCNAICPGYVNTAQGVQDGAVDDHTRRVLEQTPAGRIAEPNEIAKFVAYLVSDAGAFINGSTHTIDGGLSCHAGVS